MPVGVTTDKKQRNLFKRLWINSCFA